MRDRCFGDIALEIVRRRTDHPGQRLRQPRGIGAQGRYLQLQIGVGLFGLRRDIGRQPHALIDFAEILGQGIDRPLAGRAGHQSLE